MDRDLASLAPLSVEQPLTAYFRAGSRIKDEKAVGGFAPCSNYPVTLSSDLGEAGALTLSLHPDQRRRFGEHGRGFAVRLINRTGRRLAFAAQDSMLDLLREARAGDGRWLAVEARPAIFCGNSLHRVFLDDGEYWEFAAPEYSGTVDTDMRFVLRRGDEDPLYSATFPGSVNPGQFVPPGT